MGTLTLTMEFPLTLWLENGYYIIFSFFVMLSNPILDVMLNHGTSTMLKNGTLSPPSGPIFNIA